MVICFEEKDRVAIEAKGMTIIEFKHLLYQRAKAISKAYISLLDFANRIVDAWNIVKAKMLEALDRVRLRFEELREAYHYPTLI